jgi:hypothetical protein
VACDRLTERIAEPTLRPKQQVLPTELVLRSSCGCPPGTVERREVMYSARRKPTVARKISLTPLTPLNGATQPPIAER